MTICIAGKNEIAIDATIFIKEKFPMHTVVGIVTMADKGINGYYRSFKLYLQNNNIEIISLEDAYAIKDLIFISLQFDKIIKPSNFFSARLFNIHFSLLPGYKGMYPSVWPILNFENFGGVTLHEIDRGIDTGDIISQIKIKLDGNETVITLYKKYLELGTQIIQQNLSALLENSYIKIQQSVKGSTYYSSQSIDYKKLKLELKATSAQIDAQIRAFTFRQYQLLNVFNNNITNCKLTGEKSTQSPGKLIFEDEFTLHVSTIDYNIRLFKNRFEDFLEACKIDNLEVVKKLFPYIGLEDKTEKGWTPLMVACYNSSYNTANYLLINGAKVNAINNNGTTILMYAKNGVVNSGSNQILDVVLKYKPDILLKDFSDKNIFDYLDEKTQSISTFLKNYINDKISGFTKDK